MLLSTSDNHKSQSHLLHKLHEIRHQMTFWTLSHYLISVGCFAYCQKSSKSLLWYFCGMYYLNVVEFCSSSDRGSKNLAAIMNCRILQGTVATRLKPVGHLCHRYIWKVFLEVCSKRTLKNRPKFIEVNTESWMSFLRHSVYHQANKFSLSDPRFVHVLVFFVSGLVSVRESCADYGSIVGRCGDWPWPVSSTRWPLDLRWPWCRWRRWSRTARSAAVWRKPRIVAPRCGLLPRRPSPGTWSTADLKPTADHHRYSSATAGPLPRCVLEEINILRDRPKVPYHGTTAYRTQWRSQGRANWKYSRPSVVKLYFWARFSLKMWGPCFLWRPQCYTWWPQAEIPSNGTTFCSLRRSSQRPHTVASVHCKQCENCNMAARNRSSNGTT